MVLLFSVHERCAGASCDERGLLRVVIRVTSLLAFDNKICICLILLHLMIRQTVEVKGERWEHGVHFSLCKLSDFMVNKYQVRDSAVG